MALFSRSKKTESTKADAPAPETREQTGSTGMSAGVAHILKHARITEKATMHQSLGVYTFEVAARATKRDVIAAVRSLYKVTPRMVRIVPVPEKSRRSMKTGKTGMKHGGRKAYVYLKKDETITLE